MHYGKIVCGSLLGVVALATPALAQETRSVTFGVQATVVHDSNVSRSDAATAALRGIQREDTIFSPAVTADVLLPVSRQSLYLRGSVGYDFHDKNTQLDTENLDFEGGANLRFGPCEGQLGGSFHHGQANIQTVTLVDSENAIDSSSLGATVACTRGAGLGVTAAAHKTWSENSNAVVFQNDSETWDGTVGVTYSRPALGTLTVYAGYSDTDYPNRLLPTSASGYQTTTLGVSFERRISSRLQGVINYGYTTVETDSLVANSDFEGSTWSVDLIYRPTTRLRTEFGMGRAVLPASSIGGLYSIATNYRLTADYDLGSRIALSAGTEFVDTETDGSFASLFPVLTDSQSYAVFGGITFAQSERIRWSLNARYEDRDANAPQYTYDRTVVALSAGVAF
nr:outer membrane beta-barrel protein [Phenylobacterium haematophilum]